VEGLVFVPVSPLRPKRLKTHQNYPEPEGRYQSVQEFLQEATLNRTASEAPDPPARPRSGAADATASIVSAQRSLRGYRDPLVECTQMQLTKLLVKLLVIALYAATFYTTFLGWSVVFSTFEPATCRVGRYGPSSTRSDLAMRPASSEMWRNDFEVTVTSGSAVGVSTVAHEFPCGIYASRGPSDGSPSEHVLAFENEVVAAGGGPALGDMGLAKDVPCFVSSRDPNYIQLLDAHVHWSARKGTCLPLSSTCWLILFLPLIIFIFRPQLFQRLVQLCSQPVTLH